MDKVVISVAQDFSDTPAGRYRADSPRSGQQFREDILLPALKRGERVEVDLNGTLGFGSSFLEEAFGGLVRHGLTAKDLHERLSIKSSIPIYVKRVWQYIDEEDARR